MAGEFCLPYERPGDHHLRDALNSSGAAIVAKRFVKGSEAGILYPTAVADAIYGLVRLGAADGLMCNVQLGGQGIATAGAAGVTAGSRLTIEANTGKVVDWAPAAGVNAAIVGKAITTAAADGDCMMELLGPGAIGQGA